MRVRATRLAGALWVPPVVLAILSSPLVALNRFELGFDWVFSVAAAVVFSGVGAVVVSHRPGNAIGWIFCAIGLSQGVLAFSVQYGLYGMFTNPGALPAAGLLVSSTFFLAGLLFGLLITFALLLFPDGRLPSRRWLPVAWMCVLGITLMTAGVGLGAAQIGGQELIRRLIEGAEVVPAEGPGLAGILNGVGHVLVFAGFAAAVASLFVRRRRADRTERQQIKWFAYAAAMFALAILSYALPWPEWISEVLELATGIFIPVAIGVAILRYRLYDIDRVVNRTLVYGSLTASLAGVYVGMVILLQWVLRSLTGSESQLAIVASTLTVAALFNPSRRRIQAFIDQRFYRRKYDAAKTLENFSAKLRNETDLGSLLKGLLVVTQETVQPEHASLWLRAPHERRGDRAV